MNISNPSDRHLFHQLTVDEIATLTEDSALISLRVPADLADLFAFIPGQHLTFRASIGGVELRRNYSICSTPADSTLKVAYRQIPTGQFSTQVLPRLQVGDTIDVSSPVGRFTHQPRTENRAHYFFIAGGSGITPVLAMVAGILEHEPGSRVTLAYLNSRTESVMLIDEISRLKNAAPERLQIHHVLSQEVRDSELLDGRLTELRLHAMIADVGGLLEVDQWFLCGSLELNTTLREILVSAGASEARIHSELFFAEPDQPMRKVSTQRPGVTVKAQLGGRTTTTEGSPGETILDALLRSRPETPFACRGGVCGTCRAHLVSGDVDSDVGYALEPWEIEQGYVLTCRSHPTNDVEVNFDA